VWLPVRLDGGFAGEDVRAFLEVEEAQYVVAMGSDRRLDTRVQRLMGQAWTRSKASGETGPLYRETRYAAGKWQRQRRVIIKAEVVRHPGHATSVLHAALTTWLARRISNGRMLHLRNGCLLKVPVTEPDARRVQGRSGGKRVAQRTMQGGRRRGRARAGPVSQDGLHGQRILDGRRGHGRYADGSRLGREPYPPQGSSHNTQPIT
jgi:hypothetical protein